MRALWRGLERIMPIFCPRSQFLAGSSHAVAKKNFKVQGTDHLLSGLWTAGLTAPAPDIESVWCPLLLQVSNTTIGCILFYFGIKKKAVCQLVW
jgi:hypothetical protein